MSRKLIVIEALVGEDEIIHTGKHLADLYLEKGAIYHECETKENVLKVLENVVNEIDDGAHTTTYYYITESYFSDNPWIISAGYNTYICIESLYCVAIALTVNCL